MSNGSLAVTVKPGRVNYGDNIRFKTPFFLFSKFKIRRILRDDLFVREIMSKYRNVRVGIENQDLLNFKLNCDLSKGVTACY